MVRITSVKRALLSTLYDADLMLRNERPLKEIVDYLHKRIGRLKFPEVSDQLDWTYPKAQSEKDDGDKRFDGFAGVASEGFLGKLTAKEKGKARGLFDPLFDDFDDERDDE